ncbi:hypothetical protein C8A05DRAFT_31948 [Staphylotrichum tortipilum]|uniref:MYND-type domain-containing protein n=1 Tax=Staphylotrichum tortipilum TaxID=2831512 RepID=A0AAN6MNP1_9PEZI|nr:hypothetical protein C8A05DRAFT_31948 [Staphylotrichum longicolle]
MATLTPPDTPPREQTASTSNGPKQTAELNPPPKQTAKPGPPEWSTEVPLSVCQNYEKLTHPDIRALCAPDRFFDDRCLMCDRPYLGFFGCKSCNNTRYCSWQCQADDTAHHTLVCAQFRDITRAQPPSKKSKRIIIFPAQTTTPIFAWSELKHYPTEPAPRLKLSHPEFRRFFKHALSGLPNDSQPGRLGCLNECRALAARKLGHGLCLLEWTYPSNRKVSAEWINKSIPASLSPTTANNQNITGNTWLWTGPLVVLALDLTDPARPQLAHASLRSLRHALDFFALNLRNPCLASSRFPHATLPAVRAHDVTSSTPLARELGMSDNEEQQWQEVSVSRELPPRIARVSQGLSAVCAAVGLAWVVRAALCHGPELGWGYEEGAFGGEPSGSSDVESVDGKNENRVVFPHALDMVLVLEDGALQMRELPRTGDGLVFVHAGGRRLRREHVQALVRYVEAEGSKKVEAGRVKGFQKFWERFRRAEDIPEDLPSPYDVTPTLNTLREGDRFVVCRDVIKALRGPRSRPVWRRRV